MSINSIKKTVNPQLKLYAKGHKSVLMNFTLPADSFFSLLDIPLTGLDPLKVSVNVFYNYVHGTANYVWQPNYGGVASITDTGGTRVIQGQYQIKNNILSIGVFNNFPHTNSVPISPFETVAFNYYIFTY